MEKSLEIPPPATASTPRRWSKARCAFAFITSFLAVLYLVPRCPHALNPLSGHHLHEKVHCPSQPDPLHPATKIEWDDDSRKHSIELLQAAVRIPTQSYDDNGEPEEDPRWAPFKDFQKWLQEAFPTAWEKGKVEFVNSRLK